jgi:hypothetical protein
MVTGVKCISELATANRTTKKARYETISSCRYNAARACHRGMRRSGGASDWIQSFSSAALQGQAEKGVGFRQQERCSVSAISRLAQKANSIAARSLGCLPAGSDYLGDAVSPSQINNTRALTPLYRAIEQASRCSAFQERGKQRSVNRMTSTVSFRH